MIEAFSPWPDSDMSVADARTAWPGKSLWANLPASSFEGGAEAVAAAATLAQPGDVVLLAPGGTSFDEFTDFEARGRRFKELVHSLPSKETRQ